jgi:DNA/RNA endonuclease G (NUC1)
MKKILLSISLFAAISVGAQTIDKTIKTATVAAVNNVVFSPTFGESDTAKFVGYFGYTDTPSDTLCKVDYVVKGNSDNRNVLWGSYTLTKQEYDNWATDEDLILVVRNYLSQKGLTLTFK